MTAKDKIKLILKSILLSITFTVCVFSVIGIDSLYDNGYFLIDIVICVGLILLCKWTMSEKDIQALFFNRFMDDDDE